VRRGHPARPVSLLAGLLLCAGIVLPSGGGAESAPASPAPPEGSTAGVREPPVLPVPPGPPLGDNLSSVRELVWRCFGPQASARPPSDAGSPPEFLCGTALSRFIEAHWQDLDAETRALVPAEFRSGFDASAAGQRETYERSCESSLDTPHFRVHYSTKPGHLQTTGPTLDAAGFGQLVCLAEGSNGLLVVDAADPSDPRLEGRVAIRGSAERVAVGEGLAYVAAGDSGLQIVDVRDPASPRWVSRIDLAQPARSIAVAGALALVGGDSRLEVLDLSNPAAPSPLGTLPLPARANDLLIDGSQAFVADDEGAALVVDLTDPRSPEVLASVQTLAPALGIALSDSLLCVADGVEGVCVINVTNRSRPVVVAEVPTGAEAVRAFSRGGGYVFVAGGDQLTRIDISRPTRPQTRTLAISGPTTAITAWNEYLLVAVEDFGLRTVDTTGPTFRLVTQQVPGWPDLSYPIGVGDALEQAYAVYRNDLGMRAPLPDGEVGGGQDLIDCYIFDIDASGIAGITSGENVVTECGHGVIAYILMDPVWSGGITDAKQVAAHELFHVFQFAYNAMGGTWLIESTAVWGEGAVWSDARRNGGVLVWFRTPYLPLWSTQMVSRAYGSAHFWDFIEETTGPSFMASFWERGCGRSIDWREAIQEELAAWNRDLDESLAEFAVWNQATGERYDGLHYARDRLPDMQMQAEHSTYPVLGASVEAAELAQEAGTDYIRFLGPGSADSLRVQFDGAALLREHRAVTLVATRNQNQHREWRLPLDSRGDARFSVPDWPTYDDVTLIVANETGAVDSLDFTYSAWEAGEAPPNGPQVFAASPFVKSAVIGFRVDGATERVRVAIFDAVGRRVSTVLDRDYPAGVYKTIWDGKDSTGRKAAPGVYFYRLDIGARTFTNRLIRLD
jgi:hypothetical protein